MISPIEASRRSPLLYFESSCNPIHERRVGEILREMRPDAYVSLSSEIAPMIGKIERTATTALNLLRLRS